MFYHILAVAGGIIIFSTVRLEIKKYIKLKTVDELVDEQVDRMQLLLCEVSKKRPGKCLPNDIYDACREHIEASIKGSTQLFFDQSEFFQGLPPNLKKKLIRHLLVTEREALSFFLQDFANEWKAPEGFAISLLTNLESSLYLPGEQIVCPGDMVKQLILIVDGKCNLYGRLGRTSQMGKSDDGEKRIFLAQLPKLSWMGEFEILMEMESDYWL